MKELTNQLSCGCIYIHLLVYLYYSFVCVIGCKLYSLTRHNKKQAQIKRKKNVSVMERQSGCEGTVRSSSQHSRSEKP